MGKQRKILISGTVGDVIFYIVEGQGRVRSKPKKVRRSKATKKSARHFAKAVRFSAAIRGGLSALLPESKGRGMINRVNNACNQWMHQPDADLSIPAGELPYLYQLQFNAETALTARFKPVLEVDWSTPGVAALLLPELNPTRHISVPAGTTTIHMQVGITGCTVKDWVDLDGCFASLDISYKDTLLPTRSIQLPYAPEPGSIWLVAVALNYSVMNKGRLLRLRQQRWMPAGVIGTRWQE